MYFAIIWNHPEISLRELALVHPTHREKKSDHLITFDTDETEKLPLLASLIKWGRVVESSAVWKLLEGKKLLWTADTAMGILMKKKYGLKRFKKVELLHTDREVKEKWTEIITLPQMKGFVGVVEGYQNIRLYEIVDFDKPARSMQMWMMPAKLTHTLINIGLTLLHKENILIFDPFCWTWTTGFLANALNHNFIGSDIKLNFAKTNETRWKTTPNFHPQIFEFLDQDISKPLNKEKFSALLTHQTLIITEGRLGPIIKQTTTPAEIKEYQRRVKNLYLQFIQTITDFFPKDQRPPMVFTIPYYINQENTIESQIASFVQQSDWKMETINEVYKRENQKVWRKIIILQ